IEPLWQAALGPDVKLLRIETAVARRAVDLWTPGTESPALHVETSGDPATLRRWVERVLGWHELDVQRWPAGL
ncbi:MAG: hypothetical protein JF617_15820, partial [Burkholderiales bacterium]|nr:hypothetical protein [Burkholderiales bacterium]